MLEEQLERKLIYEVGKLGGKCLKWICPNKDGVPDRLIILPNGMTEYVEVKRPAHFDPIKNRNVPAGKPSPIQKVVIAELQSLSQQVFVIDSIEGLQNYIERLKTNLK